MSGTILVTGAGGQLGKTLLDQWQQSPLPDYSLEAVNRSALDIADGEQVSAVLSQLKPSVIINAAAYTQVDGAESDSDAAHNVNGAGVASLAAWAAQNGARLLHVSTDFVFDGRANTPYTPEDKTAPLGAYGASKLAGEAQLRALLTENYAIVRTSWLYSSYGNNFVKTMLRLMGERDELKVVNDQVGSPTSTRSLAALLFAMIRRGEYSGIYHWSDGGSISWFDFAVEILRQALAKGLLQNEIPIQPIATSEYPTPAKRPAYSVLDRSRAQAEFDCPAASWQQQLSAVLDELAQD